MDSAQPHPNAALLERFYRAFAALDADTMAACYAPDAQFRDEAFQLQGAAEIGAMWRMLCASTRTHGLDAWTLQHGDVHADASTGRAHWEPRYRFSATGRLVHNIIDAQFTFRDGLIGEHRDRFSFWSWSRQALGLPGLLLGWSPMLRRKVRARAAANLRAFRQQQGV